MRTFQQLTVRAFEHAKSVEEAARAEYREAEQRVGYWLMIDLKGSAAYRKEFGVQNAFRRAVVLAQLLRDIATGYPGTLEVFKDLGDGALIAASDFRAALELLLVVDAVREYWNVEVLRDGAYPSLESRSAITFGEAHVRGKDFLGPAIDQVARLSGYKTKNDDCIAIVSAEVRKRAELQYEAEYPFLRFGENVQLPREMFKYGEEVLWASELTVDRTARRDFEDFFKGARAALERLASEAAAREP